RSGLRFRVEPFPLLSPASLPLRLPPVVLPIGPAPGAHPPAQPAGTVNGSTKASARGDARPLQLDTIGLQQSLEFGQALRVLADLPGRHLAQQAVCRQRSRRFADVPLDRVQPITAVGQMRHAQVLARREQVHDPSRQKGPEGDLEGERATVDVVVASAGWLEVEAGPAAADGCSEPLRWHLVAVLAGQADPGISADMLLQHREFGPNATRLADIRILCQPVPRADEVLAQTQALPPRLAIRPWRLRLHPVQKR